MVPLDTKLVARLQITLQRLVWINRAISVTRSSPTIEYNNHIGKYYPSSTFELNRRAAIMDVFRIICFKHFKAILTALLAELFK